MLRKENNNAKTAVHPLKKLRETLSSSFRAENPLKLKKGSKKAEQPFREMQISQPFESELPPQSMMPYGMCRPPRGMSLKMLNPARNPSSASPWAPHGHTFCGVKVQSRHLSPVRAKSPLEERHENISLPKRPPRTPRQQQSARKKRRRARRRVFDEFISPNKKAHGRVEELACSELSYSSFSSGDLSEAVSEVSFSWSSSEQSEDH